MESQSRGVRELRWRGRRESCRTAAARPGRGARRDGTRASVVLADDRLRKLHDVQAGAPAREGRRNRAGPGGGLGRSAEAAALMIQNTQIVYAKPPADGALPDPAGTFSVVHTPLDTEAMNLKAGEVLVEKHYLSIDPYHRFGLYDPAVTRSQFPA